MRLSFWIPRRRSRSEAADEIEALLKDKPAAVLGTATGLTPAPVRRNHRSLRCRTPQIFAEVTGFMLDEYVGLPAGHPERYHLLETNLRSCVGVAPSGASRPDALSEDLGPPAGTTRRRWLRPDTATADPRHRLRRAHRVQRARRRLDSHTWRRAPRADPLDNARFFGGDVEACPPSITQGLATIMEARKAGPHRHRRGQGRGHRPGSSKGGQHPVAGDRHAASRRRLVLVDPAASRLHLDAPDDGAGLLKGEPAHRGGAGDRRYALSRPTLGGMTDVLPVPIPIARSPTDPVDRPPVPPRASVRLS